MKASASLTPLTEAQLGPPLKWAGGKRWLVPRLVRMFRDSGDRRLVEPFTGGLSVSLGLRPRRALLNDRNAHLVAFYRWLQKGLRLDIETTNDPDAYYRARSRFNALVGAGAVDEKESSELFYYLNRTGYNGLCRFNSKGGFNVPFGRYKTINYCRDFSAYKPIVEHWTFSHGDFEAIQLHDGDFLYADPPYDVEFTRYSKHDFAWSDQERLARWLAKHEGPVIASNQATPRIRELYSDLGFDVELIEAPRMISCNGDRSKALEILATKHLS